MTESVVREKRKSSILDLAIKTREVDLGVHSHRKLGEIGIKEFRDLLHYYPRRYEDRRVLPHFGKLNHNDIATVVGNVTGRKVVRSRRGMKIIRAFMKDERGGRLTALWFNQPWLEKQLFPGQRLILTGKVRRQGRQLEINVAHFEIDEEAESLSAGRIVGIYSSTQGLSQAYIRRSVHRLLSALGTIPDYLPRSVLKRFEMIALDKALRVIHFPDSEGDLQQARTPKCKCISALVAATSQASASRCLSPR